MAPTGRLAGGFGDNDFLAKGDSFQQLGKAGFRFMDIYRASHDANFRLSPALSLYLDHGPVPVGLTAKATSRAGGLIQPTLLTDA